MIELRQMQQFVAIAEEGHFRRAAERLHMAQPPLTAALRKMEAELGVVLIERTNRVERLTVAGQVFLEEARRTLAQAERAIREAKRAGQGLTGSLRATFVASVAHYLLPRVLRGYRKSHGEVALSLEEATTAQQLVALQRDQSDIGFVVLPLVDVSNLTVIPLYQGSLMAALPAGHPFAARAGLTLADLAEEHWVFFPARHGPGLYGRIMAACAMAGFSPIVVQQAVQMETIISLVAGGIGIALVPSPMAKRSYPGVLFRPLSGAGMPIPYELALAYKQYTPVLAAFIKAAQSAVRSL
ncbi:LysR family transcriptional regulator [Desulfovibrio sp. DV]|uniref:LysR family transcriptional regulator n=1 Tax=Desulfovibrio sp. DV TaxID=1844708 RepID=UPI00094B84C1|nr:LysR family transcriptional regulator [Desulfovibrio sp. DV]